MEIKIIAPRNEVVLVDEHGEPQYVEPIKNGEKLVDVGTFNDHVKPYYNGTEWVESATPEEIAIARPQTPQTPSELEQLKQAVLDLTEIVLGGI